MFCFVFIYKIINQADRHMIGGRAHFTFSVGRYHQTSECRDGNDQYRNSRMNRERCRNYNYYNNLYDFVGSNNGQIKPQDRNIIRLHAAGTAVGICSPFTITLT